MKYKLVLFVFAALAAAGCGVIPTAPLAEAPQIREMLAAPPAPPISGRAMVAYVDVSGLPASPGTAHPEKDLTFIPVYDTEKETAEISALMRDLGVFEDVLATKVPPEQASREQAVAEAVQRGFDFVLFPRLTDYRVAFSGHTGGHVGNIFLWLLLVAPAWYVHDEIFSATADIEGALIDAYSGLDVIKKTFGATEEQRMNAFQRGWSFFNVWFGPGSFGPDNWGRVAQNLMPRTLNCVKQAAIADFKQGIVKAVTERAAFRRAVAKTVVLSIGINTYSNSRISPVPFAANDAASFHDLLRRSGKARDNFSLLMQDGQAAKQDILKALTGLGGRTRATDSLLVYYCGYGTSVPGADGTALPALVPFDADPDNLAGTALTFTEMAGALAGAGAAEIVFVLDTAFSCEKMAGKTFGKAGPIAAEAVVAPLGERAAVFLAGDTGQPAGIFSELKGSLFTYYLVEAAAGDRGDTNADGLVTMNEAFLYAGERVKLASEVRGATQRPVQAGLSTLQVILKGSDKEAAIQAIMGQLGAKTVDRVELE